MSMKDLVSALGTLSKAQALDATTPPATTATTAATTTTAAAGTTEAEQAAAAEAEAAAAAAAAAGTTTEPAAAVPVVVIGAGSATDAIMKALGGGASATGVFKSFTMELENGESVEAFDGVELMKSLAGVIDANEQTTIEAMGQAVMVIGQQSAQIAELTKSLTAATELITNQGTALAGMRTDLDGVRNQPSGRRSIASPTQSAGEMNKSLTTTPVQEMSSSEFLGKCLSLQREGKMSLQEVAIAEAAIGSHVAVPDPIRAKVFKQ